MQTVAGSDPLAGFGIEESDGTDPKLQLVLGWRDAYLCLCFAVALSDYKPQTHHQTSGTLTLTLNPNPNPTNHGEYNNLLAK